MKKSEDNSDLIIRCYETDKQQTDAAIEIKLWGRSIQTSLAPCEIKTLRIPQNPDLPVVETDLLEW